MATMLVTSMTIWTLCCCCHWGMC